MPLPPAAHSVSTSAPSSSKQSMPTDLTTLDASSPHDAAAAAAAAENVSPIALLNMRFLQTRIHHLRIKLEHHHERCKALEQKEAELTLKMRTHDQAELYHFYLAAEREKTREALVKTRAKLRELEMALDELLKN